MLKAHYIITLAHQVHKSFPETISAPWGVYRSSIAAITAHIRLIQHNNQLCPRRYPFTPGWREAIMVMCLAQGHEHRGRGQGSNPHSDDSAIRTQIRCTKPLGHGAWIQQSYCVSVTSSECTFTKQKWIHDWLNEWPKFLRKLCKIFNPNLDV